MAVKLKGISLFLLTLLFNSFEAQTLENFSIESVAPCQGVKKQIIKIYFTTKPAVNAIQLVDSNFTIESPLGVNTLFKMSTDMETRPHSDRWVHVFSLEMDMCVFLKRYLGDFIYDFQVAAGLSPKTCPWPKGVYHVQNHPLNFHKLKVPSFPFGRLRVKGDMFDKTTNELIGCVMAYVTNKPNH